MVNLIQVGIIGLVDQDAHVYATFKDGIAEDITVVFEPASEGQGLAYDSGTRWAPTLQELVGMPGDPEYWH